MPVTVSLRRLNVRILGFCQAEVTDGSDSFGLELVKGEALPVLSYPEEYEGGDVFAFADDFVLILPKGSWEWAVEHLRN